MPLVQQSFAVALTIADNEAYTACATLQRLGVPVATVRRATIWTFTLDAAGVPALATTIAGIETIFNPNKHELVARPHARPAPGEVWIAPLAETPINTIGGRAVAGVRAIARYTAWRLIDASGGNVATAVLDQAVETFLCNPAFEKAIR